MIINSYRFAAPAGGLLLDGVYGNSVASAYSVRKLRTAYSGNCVRIRRSSDNAEQDIGFVSDYIDTAAIASFCGANSGFVTTWYDQNGSRNLVNATTGSQPRIYDAGSQESSNGKASIYWLGDTYNLGAIGAITNGSASQMFFVLTTSDTISILYARTISAGSYAAFWSSGTGSGTPYANVGSPTFYRDNLSALSTNTPGGLYTYFVDGGQNILTISNVNLSNTGIWDRQVIGYFGSSGYLGHIQEIIVYSADNGYRSDIITNINTYYGAF